MKLNPIGQKWVDALRSGDYRQGKRLLRNSEGEFCCLGVLCEIAMAEGLSIKRTIFGYADVLGIEEK